MTGTSSSIASYLVNALEKRLSPSGGFARIPGEAGTVVATAWAVCALNCLEPDNALAREGQHYLSQNQMQDGSVPVTQETPAAIWPTPAALFAWGTQAAFAKERSRATEFLLTCQGEVTEKQPGSVTAHDGTIVGWPWINGTYSWVEPTSFAVAALKSQAQAKHPRVVQGIRLLMDRMLEDGGWNYGNKRVFGAKLLPMPESTGIALYALKGEVPEPDVDKSLGFLSTIYPGTKTPLSLARTILGLSSFDRRPPDVPEKIDRCLLLQKRYGPFETPVLAELAMALSGSWTTGNQGTA